jgi:two-component system phosphate regulon sensor histidine kinase PhoR
MEKMDYIGLVSHEVKTPIASICGYADIIRSGLTNEETTMRYANNIYRESTRMSKLVDDMVYMEKAYNDELIPELYDKVADRIIINAIDRIKAKYRHLGVLDIVLTGNAKIMVDEIMFEELMYKLLENCVLHGNNEFKMNPSLPYVSISIKIIKENERVIIQVTDSGKGMSKQVIDKAFEIFYREDKAKSRYMGCNGLGLAVVRKIITVHGGDCYIESVEGEYTTVTITI